ncbi:MAG: hypothetical protein OSB24_09040, partial [Woeseiaceae bacterium]|nr:hypothetical protein [Woeseiaceae bacterium]
MVYIKITRSLIVFLIGILGLIPVTYSNPLNTSSADIIFIGQHIITMDSSSDVTAVAVAGTKIIATGSSKEVIKLKGKSTRVIELGDNALAPGFIDAHGHMTAVAALSEMMDLAPPP